jgi:hypothetical protein
MNLDKIQSSVLDVLQDVQTRSGRTWTPLGPTSRPIGDLDGFESLNAVEATVMLEEKLGCGDLGTESLFVSVDGQNALSVREIVQRISALVDAKGLKA